MKIKSRLAQILVSVRSNGLPGQLLRGGVGSIVLRISNVSLGLALAVVLARTLGPEGYGTYAYVFALVSILAIPAQFGVPRLVVRETAKAQANENWGLMRGVWRWSTQVILILSICLACVSAVLAWVLNDRFTDLQLTTFYFGVMLVPVIALGNLRGAALQGLRRVIWGQLPENILRPGFLVLLLLSAVWLSRGGLSASQAMGLHVVAAGAAFLVGVLLLNFSRPVPLRFAPPPIYFYRDWLMAIWPLALTAGMQQINKNADIVMVGCFLSPENVGVYRIAVQGATLVIFGQQAVAMIVSPYYARLYAQGDLMRLQRLVTVSARAAFFTALPLLVIFALWGADIIQIVFGVNYVDAYAPLMILGAGQLVNSVFGHVGILLNMTGHERYTMRGMAIAAATNIILNLAFIPLWGINGAALSTALTLVLWNLLLWRGVNNQLGIHSAAFFRGKINGS